MHDHSPHNVQPRSDIRITLLGIIIVLSVFPYFSPIRLGVDTSPLYLAPLALLLIVAISARNCTLSGTYWVLAYLWGFLCVVTLTRALITGDLGSIRVSIGLGMQAAFILLMGCVPRHPKEANRHVPVRTLSISLQIGAPLWLLAACIQFFSRITGRSAGMDFTSYFVSATRTSGDRGITALAAEPSFAGIACCVLAAAAFILVRNGWMSRRAASLTIGGYVIVALATVSFTSYLALCILAFFVARRATILAGGALIVGAAVFTLPIDGLKELRIAQLISLLTSSPELLLADESVASRIADAVGRISSVALPGGLFGHFFAPDSAAVIRRAVAALGGDVSYYLSRVLKDFGTGYRGMSSIGLLVHDFGIFGIGLFGSTMLCFYSRLRAQGVVSTGVLFLLAMFGYMTQLPFAFPTIAIVMTVLLMESRPAASAGLPPVTMRPD